jgi:mannose/fructose/N-acetylgalactosamine-specific phosphotransferase system component IIB
MPVSMIRIDDRLIHGQVTTAWLRVYSSDIIIIANDRISKDPTMKMIFSINTIPGKQIKLLSILDTVQYLQGEGEKLKVFLITPSPVDVVALMDAGLPVTKINIGGLQGRPGARGIAKVVFALEAELQAFKELDSRGVDMEVQMVPTDRVARLNLK